MLIVDIPLKKEFVLDVNWSEEKNTILKSTRNVCFEDVENAIMMDKLLDIIPHHNNVKYPRQELMIVLINNYTYYLPFVMDEDVIFLKNIIPSRKHHKLYSKKD